MKNLWQNLEGIKADIKNPISIIREQAEYLSEGTNGMLYIEDTEYMNMSANVRRVFLEHNLPNRFKYEVEICSEYLDDYSFNLFYLYYDIDFYPVVISLPSEIGEEIENNDYTSIDFTNTRMFFIVNSQDEFEDILGVIFNCEKVRTIMKNMKAIIEDENSEISEEQ